jgi:hypothetical protein
VAGNRLRDEGYSLVLRLRERGVNQRSGCKCKSNDEEEAAKHGNGSWPRSRLGSVSARNSGCEDRVSKRDRARGDE